MISFEVSGSTKRMESFLQSMTKLNVMRILDEAGQEGVNALSSATPYSTGLAARSWYYKVSGGRGVYRIGWYNSDIENGFPVVIMLEYGHGTGTGGYVQGRNFIQPAIKPIMDKLADKVWKAVTSA